MEGVVRMSSLPIPWDESNSGRLGLRIPEPDKLLIVTLGTSKRKGNRTLGLGDRKLENNPSVFD